MFIRRTISEFEIKLIKPINAYWFSFDYSIYNNVLAWNREERAGRADRFPGMVTIFAWSRDLHFR
jgi:hypothetical protein